MKKVILLSLSLLAARVYAQESTDTTASLGFALRALSSEDESGLTFYSDVFFPKKGKCVPYRNYSEWAPLDTTSCIHDWVKAEWDDVNTYSGIRTMQMCQCSCPETWDEAQICRLCLFHQRRTVTKGEHFEVTESEYLKLLKSKKE